MEYNTSGIRTKRTSDDKTYRYIYAGDKLMRMTVGDDILDFSYDANGTPWRRRVCCTASRSRVRRTGTTERNGTIT